LTEASPADLCRSRELAGVLLELFPGLAAVGRTPLRVEACLDERSMELAGTGLVEDLPFSVNSLCSERSIPNRSARSFNAAASKLWLTIALPMSH